MAQFYANINGNRGEATRMGSKASGMYGHIRGWNVGAKVSIRYDAKRDVDVVSVYRTSGSNGAGSDELIKEFAE